MDVFGTILLWIAVMSALSLLCVAACLWLCLCAGEVRWEVVRVLGIV